MTNYKQFKPKFYRDYYHCKITLYVIVKTRSIFKKGVILLTVKTRIRKRDKILILLDSASVFFRIPLVTDFEVQHFL